MNHLTQSLRRLVAAALVLLSLPVFSQLSGTYTINPIGTGTTNYASFSAAVTALTTSGVSGPVTFNVTQGTYTEQVTITAITGTSTTNKVTFKSATANTLPVNVTFASATAATNNWTLRLNGVNNLEFDGIKFSNTTPAVGTALPFSCNVNMNGTTSNISFLNCSFTGSNTLGSTNHAFFFETGSLQTGAWVFNNCQFVNTSRGINLNASATSSLTSLTVTGCTFSTLDRAITATNGFAVVAGSTATITNNTFTAPAASIGYFSMSISALATVTATGNTLNNYSGASFSSATTVTATNNTVTGGSFAQGISVGGASTALVAATVSNNTLSPNSTISVSNGSLAAINQNVCGSISVSSTNAGISITNNSINTTGSGISISSLAGSSATNTGSTAQGFTITNNRIVQPSGGFPSYGIYCSGFNIATGAGLIANNTVTAQVSATSTYYGMYPYQSKNVNIYHNTVTMTGGSATGGRALYVNNLSTGFPATGVNIQNNIFENNGLGYVAEVSTVSALGTITDLRNNVYFGSGTNPFRYNSTNHATLTAWQTATAKDANSVWGDVLFYSPTDLHVQNAVANNIGTAVASVTTDMDGQSRSTTTPDAGADEYAPLSCFAVGGITAGTISNTSFVASWTTPNTANFAKQGRIRTVGATSWTTVNASGATPDMTFGGLTASTAYEYQIRTICSAGDTSIWSPTNLVQTSACPINLQCAFTLEMTDSFGDGWNGAIVAIQQKAGSGAWTTVATAGSTFLTGTSAPPITINLCNGDSTRIVAVSPGSYSYEVGFVFKNPNGVTLIQRLPGTFSTGSFAAGFVFGSFATTCPSPCPITAVPALTGNPSCGGLPTTITATGNTSSQVVYWSTAGRPNGVGSSYTTGTIPATGDTVSARLYVRNQFNTPVVGGPPISAFASAGTAVGYSTAPSGNFPNGFGINATQPMTLDSATVRAFATTAGGTVKFVVQVYERKGLITAGTATPAGRLIARTDTITVTTTSTTGENFRIPVGLNLIPGRYHIKLAYSPSSTGRLYRSTALPTGVSYPVAIGTLGSVDSVALATTTGVYSPTRVYYLFDLKVTEGCMGPETKFFVPYFNTSVSMPFTEQFGAGIPCNWVATGTTGSATWQGKTTYTGNNYTSTSLNGTPFAMVDDDAAGSSAATPNSVLNTPELPALGYDTLTMKFLSVFKGGSWGGKGYVEVWRPVNGVFGWQTIDSLSADEGIGATATGWAPVTKSYNVTAHQSNQFKARFRYNDGISSTGTPNWAGWWAIDDFQLYGTLSPTGNVRVAVTTDIFGSEVSWKIVNTGNKLVYASGGPFPDVSPYVAATATHIDTVAIPLTGNYEFRLTDSYGDGLFDGTNTGTYLVEKLCSWGTSIIDSGSGANDNDPGGAVANVASYDSAVFNMSCIQYKNVTFNVDMNQVTQSFTTPEVNGLWNNWCGNCNPLTDANGDGIWTTTLPLPVGTTQEYKFSADAWTIQEQNNPAAPCTNGNATYTNRVIVIPATDTVLNVVCWSQCTACDVDVTLKVNMAWEVANNAISANGVHVAGDFQGWSPSTTPMTDANNDGIYEVTFTVPANSSIQYKFINGNAWGQDEPVPSACAVTGTTNRGATFAYGDSTMSPVCFGKCTDCAAGLGESLQNVSLFPNPTRGQFNLVRMDAATEVEVSVLDLQGKVLTVAKWSEGVDALSIDLSSFANGVYMVRMTSEEGSRTMRVSVQK